MTTISPLSTKRLGNSDLDITAVGFGSWAVGGPWQFGWSHQDDSDSIAAIHRALELGVNWIDTARFTASAIRGSRRPRPRRLERPAALCLHQVRHGLGHGRKVGYSLKADSIRANARPACGG